MALLELGRVNAIVAAMLEVQRSHASFPLADAFSAGCHTCVGGVVEGVGLTHPAFLDTTMPAFPRTVILAFVTLNMLRVVEAVEPGALAEITFKEIDGKSLTDIVSATAGGIRADKIATYGGDFAAYWKAASTGLGGKVFEAVAADTCNSRFRAVGDGRRLVPTAMLGDPGNAADLHVVDASGEVVERVQAKLGGPDIVNALGGPKYGGMSLVTCQESFDQLQRQLRRESAKAARRGLPLMPKFCRLSEAIESGRLWSNLPCGAPLSERAAVERIGRAHFETHWNRLVSSAVDDVARGGASAQKVTRQPAAQVGRQATSSVDQAMSKGDDLVRSSVGSADDAVGATAKLAKGVAKWAGPVAVGVEVVVAGYEVTTTEHQYLSGQITHEEREVAHAGTAGGVGGSWAGGAVGAVGGAAMARWSALEWAVPLGQSSAELGARSVAAPWGNAWLRKVLKHCTSVVIRFPRPSDGPDERSATRVAG